MGAVVSVLGSAALGVGMSAMSNKQSYSYAADVSSEMTASQPETPTAEATGNATDNALMEAERAKEKQRAAWRREQAKEIHTSGLGVEGLAQTNRKTLLGG